MGVIVETTHYYDVVGEERKSRKGKVYIKAGQKFNIMDATINCISIPVKCKNCGTQHILIAEDIYMNVEGRQRVMGKGFYHHAKGFANCKNCDKNMGTSIDLIENPKGSITFEDDLITEVENCTYEKDADLSEFLEK